MNDLYTIYENDENGRKTQKKKKKNKIQQNKRLFGFPPIPPSIKWRPTVFGPFGDWKTSRIFLSGEGKLS